MITAWSQLFLFQQGKSEGFDSCDWRSNLTQIGFKSLIFFACMTLKVDGWTWKLIGHFRYAMLGFVHHFKAIGELKLELQSGNSQLSSKLAIFCPVWPWNLKKNNMAHLMGYFKLNASFRSHRWIQTWVTVWKPPIWVKICYFCPVWPWNLIEDLEKQ